MFLGIKAGEYHAQIDLDGDVVHAVGIKAYTRLDLDPAARHPIPWNLPSLHGSTVLKSHNADTIIKWVEW